MPLTMRSDEWVDDLIGVGLEPRAGVSSPADLSPAEVFAIQCPSLPLPTFYMVAYSWAAMIIIGSAELGFYPSQDMPETAIVTILVVLGALMWARVLATLCDLATNSDPSAIEYRQALDDLNRFCHSHGLSSELKRRLRQYFHQRKHVMLAKSASGVIAKMSTSLQIEVVMLVHKHWLDKIWFLRGAEPASLVQLALRMEPFVFAPGELPEPSNLYIIHRGIVMHGLRVLTSGRMWGEEIIIYNDDSYGGYGGGGGGGEGSAEAASGYPAVIARCMTYVEVYSIARPAFFQITNSFPEAKRLVRRRAVLVIARRGLVRLVKQLRAKKAEGDGRSFIDLVLDAASASQGNLAKVVAADQQGGLAYHAMQDEIASAKAETKELRLEMRRELSALRAGIDRLLATQGMAPVDS